MKTSVLPPFPAGWYVACFSEELRDRPVTRRLCGRDVVLWRDSDGDVVATDSVCPHLGGHLGLGSRVVDGCLRCPFHHFRFRPDGSCASTPYQGKPPPTARATTLAAEEHTGMVLVWHHPEAEDPDWTVPPVDLDGFTGLRHRTLSLRAHPQETGENAADAGHFTVVHGYRRPRIVGGPEIDGSRFAIAYDLWRHPGRFGGSELRIRLDIELHGLGWSTVRATVDGGGMLAQYWVLPRPTEAGRMEMQLAVAIRPGPRKLRPGLMRWLPGRVATPLAHRLTLSEFVSDVLQDRVFWETKTYLERPALADGDGPIGAYRRYCRQFYAGRSLRARA